MPTRLLLGVALALGWLACSSVKPASPPNFVIIMADDLGYGDIGPYGSETNTTPNLARLAREGVRFTDYHSNGPVCSPTRVALLTGLYQHRFGREFEAALSGETHYDHGLPLDAVTMAEALKPLGYATGMYGKWHLGYHPPFTPAAQGFDDFRGTMSGGIDYQSHRDRSGRPDWWRNDELAEDEGYITDLVTRYSVDFIEQNKDRPFFLYVPHQAIHFPWQGPDDPAYRAAGGDYWNITKLGQLDNKDVSAKTRAMIEAVDESVGRIVAALEDGGLAENTFVFFTSDNGGYRKYGDSGFHNISSNGPLRGQKTDVYEGGHRVPAIAWWPGRIRPGVSPQTTMSFDLFPTLLEMAGARSASPPRKLDGASLMPLLFENAQLPPRDLFWRMREKAAVRSGPWKLVVAGEAPPELYNLDSDIGEQRDLAVENPQQVDLLLGNLADWEKDVDAR